LVYRRSSFFVNFTQKKCGRIFATYLHNSGSGLWELKIPLQETGAELAKLTLNKQEDSDDLQQLDNLELDELELDDLVGFDDQELADQEELEELDDQEEESGPGHDPSAPIAPAPGCAVSFYLDNKRHHAVCLAILGDELLIEHKGASRCFLFTGKVLEIVQRLRLGVASATIIVGGLKTCRYRSVPKRWLKQMVRTGQTWKGIERGGVLAPAPENLYQDDGQLDLF
jgi:hypothetical protein